MKKYIILILISSIVSLIVTFSYLALVSQGVSYSPGITTSEMDDLSYSDATQLMAERSHEMTGLEVISSNITSLWFWKTTGQLWIAMVIVGVIVCLINEKVSTNNDQEYNNRVEFDA